MQIRSRFEVAVDHVFDDVWSHDCGVFVRSQYGREEWEGHVVPEDPQFVFDSFSVFRFRGGDVNIFRALHGFRAFFVEDAQGGFNARVVLPDAAGDKRVESNDRVVFVDNFTHTFALQTRTIAD